MAITDPNILTGTINICISKDVTGPKFKDFYPKTESAQIVDFNSAALNLFNNKLANYMPIVTVYKTTLIAESWQNNNNSIFTKKYIVANTNINEDDIIEVAFINKNIAKAAGISTVVESIEGKFILTAKSNPVDDLDIYYYIYKNANAIGNFTVTKSYMPKLKSYNQFTLYKENWVAKNITLNNKTFTRYEYTYTINNVTDNDIIDVCVSNILDADNKALKQTLYPVVETTLNKIKLFADKKPTANIDNMIYRIYEGTAIDEDDNIGYMPKVKSNIVSIEPTLWAANSLSGTNCVLSTFIEDPNIKATDVVEIIVHPDSIPFTTNIKLNPIAKVENGKCTIYCVNRPTVTLKFVYHIYHCKSIANANLPRQNYMKKLNIKTATLNANSWTKNTNNSYNYKYTLANNIIKANDVVELIINNLNYKTANDIKMCPVVETMNGYMILYSRYKPTENIGIEYYIFESE